MWSIYVFTWILVLTFIIMFSTWQSFVYGNNIYYQASPFALAEQVTTDGDALYVFNGLSDYLYEGMFNACQSYL